MLQPNDIYNSFIKVFNSLHEDVFYKLKDATLEQISTEVKEKGYAGVSPFYFFRNHDKLIFNWKNKTQTTIKVSAIENDFQLAFSLSLAFSLAFPFAVAFSTNQIECLNPSLNFKPIIINDMPIEIY